MLLGFCCHLNWKSRIYPDFFPHFFPSIRSVFKSLGSFFEIFLTNAIPFCVAKICSAALSTSTRCLNWSAVFELLSPFLFSSSYSQPCISFQIKFPILKFHILTPLLKTLEWVTAHHCQWGSNCITSHSVSKVFLISFLFNFVSHYEQLSACGWWALKVLLRWVVWKLELIFYVETIL